MFCNQRNIWEGRFQENVTKINACETISKKPRFNLMNSNAFHKQSEKSHVIHVLEKLSRDEYYQLKIKKFIREFLIWPE